MKADLEPIIYKEPREDMTIIPVFDLHVGSEHFQKDRWEKFIDAVKKDPSIRLVIGGDMIDNGIKSSVTLPYEQTMRPREQKAYVAATLSEVRDRVLCGISGNHENRSVKEVDDNPLYDVFAKLDIEDKYRENGAFLFLTFGNREEDGKQIQGKDRPFYCILVHHGAGGGVYIGSQAYKQERYGQMVEGLDILITGHTHKPLTFPAGKLVCDPQNKKVSVKEFRVVTANSWLDYGGYAFRKLLPPTASTMTEIHLCGTRKQISVTQ